MNKDKQILKCKNNCTLKFILLIIVLFVITTVCITFGSVKIDVGVTFKSLINNILNKEIFAKDWPNNIDNIVFKLRLPRLLLAIVSGGALALWEF